MKPQILVRNLSHVMTMCESEKDPLGLATDVAILIEDNCVKWMGKNADAYYNLPKENIIDATGYIAMPGLIDCHTHLVFAGDRAEDFYARTNGETYAQIMARGGGIQTTVKATRAANKEELVQLALPRIQQMMSKGVMNIEVKSGYGLNLNDEIKLLEVIQELNTRQVATLVPTFMGAHAVPVEFTGNADSYVDLLVREALPEVARRKLAMGVDVFVEQGAFSVEQGRKIIAKTKELGLVAKVHADQLTHSGGARLAAEMQVTSASHLEYTSDEDLAEMGRAGVIAEMLPLSELYLGVKKVVDVARLRSSGVKIAIGTDFNPGSAMCNDLLLAMRLAITQRKMTVEESYLGVTYHAACALGIQDRVGQIKPGMWADIFFFEAKSPWELAYDWTKYPRLDRLYGLKCSPTVL